MSHTVIRNRFKRSTLPSNWSIAEALRDGTTTIEQIAADSGVQVKTITKRLQVAGWDARGQVIPPWLQTNPGIAVCKRCGRERYVKAQPAPEWCADCRSVTRQDGAA